MTTLTTAEPRLVAIRETDEEGWREARRTGITATEVRDWVAASDRRGIIDEKVSGVSDLSTNRYYEHGKHREPAITAWMEAAHGVIPTRGLYAHPDNPRHLCSPDGYLAGFTLGYEPGAEAVTVEVKTTTADLTPGTLDSARVLVRPATDCHFAKMRYMRQVQWQMYVMNAARCLFIWEPFETVTDPETGHFTVTGPPEWCLIPRDQKMIDRLVEEADEALRVIDLARAGLTASGLPPMSDLPTEHAALLADYLAALDAEKVAAKAKKRAWDALSAVYLAEGADDLSVDAGIARLTVSTTRGVKRVFQREVALLRAPKALAAAEALMDRYSEDVPTETRKMTITAAGR